MALSGSFTGTTNNQYIQSKITWSATQDIAGNFSTVTATLTYSRTNSGYTTEGKWSGSITINGTTTNYSTSNTIVITQNSNTVAMTAKVKVPHDNDGKKSVYISCTGGMTASSISLKTTSCASTITLDTIPRQATITSAPDFTDSDNPTIYFSNPANCPMDVWLEPNPVGDHLCVRNNISNTGSYTWTLTDAEREQLRNKCTGKTSCTIRLGLYSTVGGITYADYKDKTFTMSNNTATKPSVTINYTLNNDSLPSKFTGMCIQGKSRLNINLTAEGKYGANITNYSVSVGERTYYLSSFTTDVITNTGDVDIVATVRDTRGFTGTASDQISVLAYSKPLVIPIGNENAILCYRSDGNGVRIGNSTSVWIKAKRSYYNLSGKNGCALHWRRRLITEAWNDSVHKWQDLIEEGNTITDEYNGLISYELFGEDADFDLHKSYAVQIRAIDDIGEYDIKEFEIPTQDVALHLGAGGKNVSVGTYCDYSEDYTFRSAWKSIFDNGILGSLLNHNVTDVLEFPKDCIDGITPIIINSSTNKANLPAGDYAYSVGIVHKRAEDQYNVILVDYVSGKIAINVHLSGTWTGWKYITPQ
jgi:hypothetical protein